jgi:hypothetical protein
MRKIHCRIKFLTDNQALFYQVVPLQQINNNETLSRPPKTKSASRAPK